MFDHSGFDITHGRSVLLSDVFMGVSEIPPQGCWVTTVSHLWGLSGPVVRSYPFSEFQFQIPKWDQGMSLRNCILSTCVSITYNLQQVRYAFSYTTSRYISYKIAPFTFLQMPNNTIFAPNYRIQLKISTLPKIIINHNPLSVRHLHKSPIRA